MAYIQRLVLQGFKSFNKKIAIPFSQTFSVVCGPNGSGKSNINDAVCFVLEGQAPSPCGRTGFMN